MARATGGDDRQLVVSVTPLRLEADSRTFKQAASVARLGYRSIVVETGSSGSLSRASLPFELRSVVDGKPRSRGGTNAMSTTADGAPLPAGVPNSPRGVASSFVRRVGSAVRSHVRVIVQNVYQFIMEQALSEPVQFVRHVGRFLKLYFLLPLRSMPKGSLYYLHAFYQFPAVYLMCLLHRARFVYDAHDFYSQLEDDDTLSHYWRNWVLPWEKAVERLCVSRAAAVVTVNEGIADLMRERFGCNPVVIRNAHDVRLDRAVEFTIRDATGVDDEAFLLVSVGNWKPGMAIDEMFAALESLPPSYHLAFLGAGFPSYAEELRVRRLSARVHLLDPVSPDTVVPFIRTADAAIVLYYAKSVDYQFSLPNRFFQPIAASVPLLYPPLPEIVRLAEPYGVGLMIDPQNPATVVDALRRLGNEPSLLASIRLNLAKASADLSWETEEKELDRLLQSLIGAPGDSSAPRFHRSKASPSGD